MENTFELKESRSDESIESVRHTKLEMSSCCSSCVTRPNRSTFSFFVLSLLSIVLVSVAISQLVLVQDLSCTLTSFWTSTITMIISLWVSTPKFKKD